MIVDIIGSLAATFTTISFLPQVIHTIKTKDVSGISLGMYIVFWTGVLFWLIYGLLLNNMPIIVANIITITFVSIILTIKIREESRKN